MACNAPVIELIISAAGLVLKRGHELEIVLKYFDKATRLVR